MGEDEKYYCPEHEYNPPANSGWAFCPKCEIESSAVMDMSAETMDSAIDPEAELLGVCEEALAFISDTPQLADDYPLGLVRRLEMAIASFRARPRWQDDPSWRMGDEELVNPYDLLEPES